VTAAKHPPAILVFLALALAVLAADLLSKSLAFRHVAGQPVAADPDAIPPHDAITVVPSILSLKLMVNTGAVFGIGQGQRGMFIVISLIAVVVIAFVFLRSAARDWISHAAWALILAGALGNLYDRFVYSGVRDMLWLFPGVKLPFAWRWPAEANQFAPWVANTGSDQLYPWIFNVADVALLLGVTTVIFLSFIRERAAARAQAKNHSPK
jgi:signal peptidase II